MLWAMATARPEYTNGIKFLEEHFWDAEGKPTDDTDKAVRGEVLVQYPDGTTARHLLVTGNEDDGTDAEAAPEPKPKRRIVRK